MDLRKYISTIEDFPKKGITFRDINKLLENPIAFNYTIDKLVEKSKTLDVDVIATADARGFIIGAPIAYLLKKRLVLIRKKNKLPGEVHRIDYKSEYSTESFEIQKNKIKEGDKVLLIDDVLATGGTIIAMTKLIEKSGGIISAALFVLNLNLPESKSTNYDFEIYSLINY